MSGPECAQEDDVGTAFEPPEYQGMLFYDGVDARGRPVVVVNADVALGVPTMRKAALEFMLHRLEPIISQVECGSPAFTVPPFLAPPRCRLSPHARI